MWVIIIIVNAIVQSGIIGRAYTVNGCRCILNTDISIVRDTGSTGFSAFGSNQNYTVRCFRTIDSCRRSVFQYGDTFNIIRVKVVHGTTFYTVNQDIGRCIIQRSYTADSDITSVFTGTSLTCSNCYTRHQALQTA